MTSSSTVQIHTCAISMPAFKAMSEFKSWAVNMLEHTGHITAAITDFKIIIKILLYHITTNEGVMYKIFSNNIINVLYLITFF
jgi:hypothetical protein